MDNREYFICENIEMADLDANVVKEIYDKIGDNASKKIFTNRLQFSLFEDNSYLGEVLKCTPVGGKLYSDLCSFDGNIYIYAAGRKGVRIKEAFSNVKWKKFIDKKAGGVVCGLPVVSIDDFAKEYVAGKTIIVISCANYIDEIKIDLIDKGVQEKDIIVLEDLSSKASKEMYFEGRCLESQVVTDGFIDVGGFTGSTSLDYFRFSGNVDANVWVFEPDAKNYKRCVENLSGHKNAVVYQLGVSDCTENALMSSNGGMSQVVRSGSAESLELDEIHLVALDDCLVDKSVNFIKIDVEGFEENVLRGAQSIIRNQRPILAVSVYHKRDDIWNLPRIILDICNDYRFHLGHYTLSIGDTVLYCIPEK